MDDRQSKLLNLIEKATGKTSYIGVDPEEYGEIDGDEDTIEAEHTITSNLA